MREKCNKTSAGKANKLATISEVEGRGTSWIGSTAQVNAIDSSKGLRGWALLFFFLNDEELSLTIYYVKKIFRSSD